MGARQRIFWRIVPVLCLSVLPGLAVAQGRGTGGGGHGPGGPGHGPGPGAGHGSRPGWGGGGWHGGPGRGFDGGRPYGWHGDGRGYTGRGYAGHGYAGPGNWHRGHWYHGPHNGRSGWWWIVGPSWYFYLAPVYPYPDPYLPPALYGIAPPPPGVPAQYWYYCADPPGYYPYVPQCNFPWRTVRAWPPA